MSPYGVIPWTKVSRLNDDEMKCLMIDVVDRAYRFIHKLFDENTGTGLLIHLARGSVNFAREPARMIDSVWPVVR